VETGALIPGDQRAVKSFQRADTRTDGSFTLGDQLFLAQYLAGLRTLGEDSVGLNALNAASVFWDEGGDRITLQDRFLMALREVGLRDEFFQPFS
jgi:hypothetical protein